MQKSVLIKIQSNSGKSSLFLLVFELKEKKNSQTIKATDKITNNEFNLNWSSFQPQDDQQKYKCKIDWMVTNNLYNYRESAILKNS